MKLSKIGEKEMAKEVITQEQADKIVQVILSAFKDGVLDE